MKRIFNLMLMLSLSWIFTGCGNVQTKSEDVLFVVESSEEQTKIVDEVELSIVEETIEAETERTEEIVNDTQELVEELEKSIVDSETKAENVQEQIINYIDDFDPIFYANTYSDIKDAIGTDANNLYNHYLNNGKSEGRLPNASARSKDINTQVSDIESTIQWHGLEYNEDGTLKHPLFSVTGDMSKITDAMGLDTIKAGLPSGSSWGYDKKYKRYNNATYTHQACGAFANYLQDSIFGTAKSKTIKEGTFEVNVYDIIYIYPDHVGFVLGIDNENRQFTIAEGNVIINGNPGVVQWGTKVSYDVVYGVCTRYGVN
ncbi:MAG: hypothetical protein ACRC7V_07290 [Lachnospiraceae bacterium]